VSPVAESQTQILEFIRRAREAGHFMNIGPQDILVAWAEERLVKIVTRYGIVIEIDSRGYISVGSVHECYCGG